MMKNRKLFYGILIVVILTIVGISLFVYLNKSIPSTTRTIEQVKEQYEAELMSIEGVVGVGIGECDGAPCIKVYLEKEIPGSILFPIEIEGFKVDYEITGPIEALGQVKIQADRDTYTPLMSSTGGIGLTPIYTLGRHPETIKFRWHTNYGHFVSWGPPDFKVNELGPEVINSGEKIYWSYDASEMDVEKSSVQISLRVEDAQSGQLLTESSLEIGWEDRDTAKVKK